MEGPSNKHSGECSSETGNDPTTSVTKYNVYKDSKVCHEDDTLQVEQFELEKWLLLDPDSAVVVTTVDPNVAEYNEEQRLQENVEYTTVRDLAESTHDQEHIDGFDLLDVAAETVTEDGGFDYKENIMDQDVDVSDNVENKIGHDNELLLENNKRKRRKRRRFAVLPASTITAMDHLQRTEEFTCSTDTTERDWSRTYNGKQSTRNLGAIYNPVFPDDKLVRRSWPDRSSVDSLSTRRVSTTTPEIMHQEAVGDMTMGKTLFLSAVGLVPSDAECRHQLISEVIDADEEHKKEYGLFYTYVEDMMHSETNLNGNNVEEGIDDL